MPAKSNPAIIPAPDDLTIDAVSGEHTMQKVFAPVSTAVAVPIDTIPVAPDLISLIQLSTGLTRPVPSLSGRAPADADSPDSTYQASILAAPYVNEWGRPLCKNSCLALIARDPGPREFANF